MRRLLVLLVRLYQRTLARLLPPSCRFMPSCSQYMLEALELHGSLRGLGLGLWRILRCNPWCNGGYDPVPLSRDGTGRADRPAEGARPQPGEGAGGAGHRRDEG